MKFDIQLFYDQHHIDYITKGTNVKKGEVNIACPFCGDDPSYHLGVNRQTLYWSCWRNKRQHRGRTLHRLIMKLLKCTYNQAAEYLGEDKVFLDNDAFEELIRKPESIFDDVVERRPSLLFPKEFRHLSNDRESSRFREYILSRGFFPAEIDDLIEEYQLMYSIEGTQGGRLILPIFYNGALVSWTGRSISKKSNLRYLSLSESDGAVENIKNILPNYDSLYDVPGHVLFICEGPWDFIKVDFYARKFNCRATCLFNKMATQDQIILLSDLAGKFKRFVLLLDSGELADTLSLESDLSFLGKKVIQGMLPQSVSDPGELTYRQVRELCSFNLNLLKEQNLL